LIQNRAPKKFMHMHNASPRPLGIGLCRAIAWYAVFACSAAFAQTPAVQIDPYTLPDKVQQALIHLATQTDVLILGELHGTQEVPAIAAALLEPLSKLGYGALALEIPADELEALTNWALGKTEKIPAFFAQPWPDGRPSVQALALIRAALSPPHSWKLICFDLSEEDAADFLPPADQNAKQSDPPEIDDGTASFAKRDAKMASHFSRQRSAIPANPKVLAICGSLHARTAQLRLEGNAQKQSAAASLNKFWPCFAAQVATSHADWHVRSINVEPHAGGFFAMMSVEGGPEPTGGKVHPIRSSKRLDEAEARPLNRAAWDWQLDLPRATPATFLATPSLPVFESQPAIDK
jgi:hypothetical protein